MSTAVTPTLRTLTNDRRSQLRNLTPLSQSTTILRTLELAVCSSIAVDVLFLCIVVTHSMWSMVLLDATEALYYSATSLSACYVDGVTVGSCVEDVGVVLVF